MSWPGIGKLEFSKKVIIGDVYLEQARTGRLFFVIQIKHDLLLYCTMNVSQFEEKKQKKTKLGLKKCL